MIVKLSGTVDGGLLTGLGSIQGVDRVEAVGSEGALMLVPASGGSIIEDVSLFVRDKNIEVDELYVERGHLDQVFRELTNAQ